MGIVQMVIALIDILDALTTAIGLLALWEAWNQPQQVDHRPAAFDEIEVDTFVDLARRHARPNWSI